MSKETYIHATRRRENLGGRGVLRQLNVSKETATHLFKTIYVNPFASIYHTVSRANSCIAWTCSNVEVYAAIVRRCKNKMALQGKMPKETYEYEYISKET